MRAAYPDSPKFRIVLEFGAKTDSYAAIYSELSGCASAGVTEDEARKNLEEAIRLYLSAVTNG
jgi:predicted RNase H-like HicB family nuclease